MEATRDDFWTPMKSNKGWRTRREQQDAYRKALDEQIEQRKQMDKERMNKFRASSVTPPAPITDPVKHLMPWIQNDSEGYENTASIPASNSSSTSSLPIPIPAPIPPPPNYQYPSTPPPNYQYPSTPPSNYQYPSSPPQIQYAQPMFTYPHPGQNPSPTMFVMANPNIPPPTIQPSGAYQMPVMSDSQTQMPGPASAATSTTSLLPGVQPSKSISTNVAYGYYGSSTLPPPPPTVFTPPYAQYPGFPHNGGQIDNLVASNQNYLLPETAQTGPSVLPPLATPSIHPSTDSFHTPDPPNNDQSIESNDEKMIVKPHVSQSCLDAPDMSKFKDHYRNDLQRQMDERKRVEDERRAKEKEEEDRLHRKVQEDQERMRLEYEAESRARALKEEQLEKDIELAKIRLEEQRQKDLEIKAKEQAERRRQLLEESQKNARVCLKSSADRYYHRDEEIRENPWDSKPIPTVEKMVVNSTNCHNDRGDGDFIMASTRKNQESEVKNRKPKERPSTYRVEERDPIEYTQQYSAKQTPRSSVISRSVEEINSRVERNELGDTRSTSINNDKIMCPKCEKSFSSTDIQVPKTTADRQSFLNFLENISRHLNKERDEIAQGSYDWRR